jgi:hypothetical protein
MLDFTVLCIAFIFIYVNIILASKLNLQVLGFIAGLFLILTGFWLFDGVYLPGVSTTTFGEYNATVEGNVTMYTAQNVTEVKEKTKIVTPYFDFFSALQVFCFLGGIYFVLEFIYRQYNL